jgi:hypothetical protein
MVNEQKEQTEVALFGQVGNAKKGHFGERQF